MVFQSIYNLQSQINSKVTGCNSNIIFLDFVCRYFTTWFCSNHFPSIFIKLHPCIDVDGGGEGGAFAGDKVAVVIAVGLQFNRYL